MDLLPHSLFIYAAASGVFSALVVIFAVLALMTRRRNQASAAAQSGGSFGWAEGELEQIAAQRRPEPRQEDPGFDESLFRAEMVTEARRLIAEVSAERRDAPTVNVEEALAHGLGVTSSSGLRRRLSSHLEHLEAARPRVDGRSRIKQLRHLVEAEDAPSPLASGALQLEWRARR